MALKRPDIWDKKSGSVIEQGEPNLLTTQSTNESIDGLTNESTNQSTDESINWLTDELTNQSINLSTDQSINQSINQSDDLLEGLKRQDSDKKIMGFHLTGDVRRALKRLKADDYEMSEVVNEMLRKYLPKKYFKESKKR